MVECFGYKMQLPFVFVKEGVCFWVGVVSGSSGVVLGSVLRVLHVAFYSLSRVSIQVMYCSM